MSTPPPADPRKRKSTRAAMRQEMRSSLLLPIALGLAVLLVAVLAVLFSPWPFTETVIVVVALLLFGFLLWSSRDASWGLRLLALLVALPAVIGASVGLVSGSLAAALLGMGLTLLLLVLLRFFSTPLSFRAAYGRYRKGDLEGALEMVDKSVAARPDFWESYQLRAMIHLAMLQLGYAERDARQAVLIRPDADAAHNTLGHVYLAQERFDMAEEAYGRALDLSPGYALYLYHLGLAEFRQGKYADAAESFVAATQGTLPTGEYDLQARYYLARSWEETGEPEAAAQAEAQLAKFAYALEPLQESIAAQPDYPHVELVRADMTDLAARTARAETAAAVASG